MTEETTTECLYYRAFNSYLLQETSFKSNFEMLKKQYLDFPESFQILSQNEVNRLLQMEQAFKTNTFNIFNGSTAELGNNILPKMEEVEIKHRDLVFDIYQNRETTLIPHTGPIDSACFEYPVLYGNIDLMAQSGKCAYAIEFKTDTASHAIVGQVMKYYIGLSLLYNLKFFNDVKLITICPGYDQAAYNGLKQIGATMLLVDPKSLKVTKAP